MDSIHKIAATPKDSETDLAGGESSSNSSPHSDKPRAAHVEDRYAEHGPPIDNEYAHAQYEEDYKHQSHLWWSRVRHHIRDPAAEFFGCFTMIIFGDGSVAQVVLSGNTKLPLSSQDYGDYQSISWG